MNPSINRKVNRKVARTVTVLAAGAIAALGTAGGAQAITLPTTNLAQLVTVANPVSIGGAQTSDRGTAPTGTAPVGAVGVGALGGAGATGSTSDLGSGGTTQDGTAATGGTTQDGTAATGGTTQDGTAATGGTAAGGAATGGTAAGGGGAGGGAGAGTSMTPSPCGCVASSSDFFGADGGDDEDRLWLYIVTKTVPESQDSPVAFKLSHPTNHVVEADWTTDQCDTAKPVEDYKNSGGHIRFEPGEVEKDVVVPLVNDKVIEPSEKFCVRVDHVSGATPYRDWEFAQIDDDDHAVSVSLGDIKVKPRARRACFVMKVNGQVTQPLKVQLDTVDGSARQGHDFAAMHQTMLITPGMTSQKISIALANKKHSGSKSFELHLGKADEGVEIEHGSGHAKLMGSGEAEHRSGGTARLTSSKGSRGKHHRKAHRHGAKRHHRHGRH